MRIAKAALLVASLTLPIPLGGCSGEIVSLIFGVPLEPADDITQSVGVKEVFEAAKNAGDNAGQGQGQGSSPSDLRLKRSVRLVDTMPNGIKLYAFQFRSAPGYKVGVMAQDLLRNAHLKHAVSVGSDGYYRVDYDQLGLRMVSLASWQRRGRKAVLLTTASAQPRQQ